MNSPINSLNKKGKPSASSKRTLPREFKLEDIPIFL